jgi:CBS domain-containing protein
MQSTRRTAPLRLRLRLSMPTVGELMTKDLITVAPTATVAEAATLMGERHVGSALVLDGDRLAGIFTERDIVRALGEHFDAAGHPVSSWMTRNPATISPGASAQEALEAMLQGGFRHLPVTEEDRVLGMLSLRDLAAVSEG